MDSFYLRNVGVDSVFPGCSLTNYECLNACLIDLHFVSDAQLTVSGEIWTKCDEFLFARILLRV